MTVCYFDVDDEITGAVSRVRASDGPLVTLVLPAASRIATSRINFLILAREARARGRTLAIVSAEPGVRALAVSAGLPAYPTVDESERALATAAPAPRRATGIADPSAGGGGSERSDGRVEDPEPGSLWAAVASGSGAPVDAAPVDAAPSQAIASAVAGTGIGPDPGAGRSASPSSPTRMPEQHALAPHSAAPGAGSTAEGTRTSGRAHAAEDQARARGRARRRTSLLLRLAVIGVVLSSAAAGAYLYLPSATIAITPRTEVAGPVEVTVVADPALRVVDQAQLRIPADRVEVPLMVSDEFPATGTVVTQIRASGTVRLTSENTLNDVSVPAGTRVSTAGGIDFATREDVVVPRASFATGPTTRDVAVQAVQGGPSGNVAAGTITRLPGSLDAQLITVRNPQATTGGRRAEAKQVTRKDYDSALRQLTSRLDTQLAGALGDPVTIPQGLTLHPATAGVEDVRADRASADVVGTRATSFTLTVSATGKVLGVDRTLVEGLAVDELRRMVPTGTRLLEASISTTIAEPVVEGDTIRYVAQARALQWRPVDPATIVTAVRGRSIQEARTTLERYGTADVSHWPDFLDSMPAQGSSITVAVREPTAP